MENIINTNKMVKVTYSFVDKNGLVIAKLVKYEKPESICNNRRDLLARCKDKTIVDIEALIVGE